MSALATFCVIMGVFLVLVYLMFIEKMPPIWGLILMGTLVLLIVQIMRGGITYKDYYTLLGDGPAKIAATIMTFILAGVFARSQIDTGIVENIVKKAAELGGDRPLAVALLLGFASAYITVGAFAGGCFVAHVTALPILISVGLSPLTAALIQGTGCLQAVLFWAPHWVFFGTVVPGVTMANMTPFLIWVQPFVCLSWVAFVIYQFKKNKLPLRWAATSANLTKVEHKVPLYALLCPAIPLVLILGFNMPVNMTFLISTVASVIITHPGSGRKMADYPNFFTKVFVSGVTDMNYLIGILLAEGVIMKTGDIPAVKIVLGQALGSILPSSAIGFIIFFGLFMAVGGLFRGPAQPWSMGSAVIASIVATGKYPMLVMGALIGVYNVFTIVADVTTGYTIYICSLAKISIITFLKKTYLHALAYGLIGIVIITIYFKMW